MLTRPAAAVQVDAPQTNKVARDTKVVLPPSESDDETAETSRRTGPSEEVGPTNSFLAISELMKATKGDTGASAYTRCLRYAVRACTWLWKESQNSVWSSKTITTRAQAIAIGWPNNDEHVGGVCYRLCCSGQAAASFSG